MLVAIMKTIACIFLYVYYVEATELLRSTFRQEYGVLQNSTITRVWDQAQTLVSYNPLSFLQNILDLKFLLHTHFLSYIYMEKLRGIHSPFGKAFTIPTIIITQ